MEAELIHEFAARFHLDPQRDFEALFRCWNTGRPNGQTYDPAYVEKGLRRAALARRLREQAEAGERTAPGPASQAVAGGAASVKGDGSGFKSQEPPIEPRAA